MRHVLNTESDGKLTETETQINLITDDIVVHVENVDERHMYVCEYTSADIQIAVAVPAAQIVISGEDLCGVLHEIILGDNEPTAYRLSILHRQSMQYIAAATARVTGDTP